MRQSIRALVPALSLTLPTFTSVERGEKGSKNWRMYLQQQSEMTGKTVVASSWHDVPRCPRSCNEGSAPDPLVVTYVNEIPCGTRAKLEMSKSEEHNPIAQDLFKKKEGKPLRFFTYGDIPFNYGFVPRTWEDPDKTDPDTKCNGDGDPIDVVQLPSSLSAAATATGACLPVRVLGVLALIDEGETDWKIIAEAVVPGKEKDGYGSIDRVPAELKAAIVDWFRNYKTTDGKPQNEFAFGGEIRGPEAALAAIHDCAAHYDAMIARADATHGYWLN